MDIIKGVLPVLMYLVETNGNGQAKKNAVMYAAKTILEKQNINIPFIDIILSNLIDFLAAELFNNKKSKYNNSL